MKINLSSLTTQQFCAIRYMATPNETPVTYLRGHRIRAFTLIEVLVSSVVMVILVGLVAYITGSVLDTWNRSSGKLSANAEARLALDLIAQDLETAVLHNNGQQWLRVEGPASMNAAAPYDSGSVVLKLFAPALDRPGGDGICAIAYKLEYRESYTDGPDTYALYRRVVEPDITLELYLSSDFDNPATSSQGNLEGSNVLADWSADAITQNANYLISNIVEFKVVIYDSDSAPNPVNANSATNAIVRDYAFGGDANLPDPPDFDEVREFTPLYADIILTVVTDQGMDLLNNIAQGLVPVNAIINVPNILNQHSETLIRRVYFKSRPI